MELENRLCKSCQKNYFKCLPSSPQQNCSRFCEKKVGISWIAQKEEKRIIQNKQSKEFRKADRDRAIVHNMKMKYD